MNEHLSDDLLERYRRNQLRGEELVYTDDHIAVCAACRMSLEPSLSRTARAWEALLAGEHLTFAQLEATIDGTLDAGQRQDVESHAATCDECADELGDLRLFRGRKRVFLWSAVAAAALIVVAITALLSSPRHVAGPEIVVAATTPPAPPPPPVSAPVLRDAKTTFALRSDGTPAGLLPRDAETLDQLRKGIVATAALFTHVTSRNDSLRGETPPGSALSVEKPLGFILEDRPTFHWSDREGDAVYRVGVYDQQSGVIAESTEVTTHSWRPDDALPRGKTYQWQVRRRQGTEVTSAPAPPAPPARFRIVSARGAEEIRKARAESSHLLLALAYTREGMLDDARKEIDALAKLNPESEIVREVRETLGKKPGTP